jgi:RNA polymerase sigma-70 factor (ECF subfamily)
VTSWLERIGRDGVPLDGARRGPAAGSASSDATVTRESRFTELYREHYPFVLRFALRRLRALEAAQDATIATFAVVWSRFDEVPELPRAWIYRIARSVVSLELRQRMRDERSPHAPGTARLHVTENELADDPVLRALNELREDDREVLQLRAWEDLSGAEIGEVLGCSPNDAAVRLHEAQLRLRELLGPHTHHDGRHRAGSGDAGSSGTEPQSSADASAEPAERRSVPRRKAAVPTTRHRRDTTVTRRVSR